MDALARSGSVLLKKAARALLFGGAPGLAIALAAACAPRGERVLVGNSTAAPVHGERAKAHAPPSEEEKRQHAFEALGVSPDFRTTLTKLTHARVRSTNHLVGGYTMDVFANEAGAKALALGARAEHGAIVVADHTDAKGQPGPIFVMIEGDDDAWRYAATDATFDHAEASVPKCGQCHDEAPNFGLFRFE